MSNPARGRQIKWKQSWAQRRGVGICKPSVSETVDTGPMDMGSYCILCVLGIQWLCQDRRFSNPLCCFLTKHVIGPLSLDLHLHPTSYETQECAGAFLAGLQQGKERTQVSRLPAFIQSEERMTSFQFIAEHPRQEKFSLSSSDVKGRVQQVHPLGVGQERNQY